MKITMNCFKNQEYKNIVRYKDIADIHTHIHSRTHTHLHALPHTQSELVNRIINWQNQTTIECSGRAQ